MTTQSIVTAPCIAVIVHKSLDIVEYDLETARRHRRELINDYGYPRHAVKLIGFADEKTLYSSLELAGVHT